MNTLASIAGRIKMAFVEDLMAFWRSAHAWRLRRLYRYHISGHSHLSIPQNDLSFNVAQISVDENTSKLLTHESSQELNG